MSRTNEKCHVTWHETCESILNTSVCDDKTMLE